MKIAILVTGGTFDKEYDEHSGNLFFRETHLKEMLHLGRCRLSTRIEVIMLKDSLEMTARDRARILRSCLDAPEQRLIITHGTDTMEITARYLQGRVPSKTIILTGAMIPYRFGSSDGLFNIGSALAFSQTLPPGVFVAMNGRLFPANRVTKNKKRGYFHLLARAASTPDPISDPGARHRNSRREEQ